MKKFRGVLDGIRQTVNSPKPDASLDVDETLRSDKFQLVKTVRHGFPHAPSCIAYDPLQRLVAIGTKFGVVCILGRPGVDMFITHEGEPVVLQILFVINDGSLITVCSNQTISHWSFRQKKAELLRSLQFNREGLSYCFAPYQSKWMYCGTDKGNVYMLHLEKFELSNYVINWNKAMELSRRTHPGAVVHISDNLQQPNNLLIGFDAGLVVLWDLKTKAAVSRFSAATPIHTVSWFSDARNFVCGHVDGSLSTWNCKQPQRPVSVIYPHGQLPNGAHEECRPIMKVEWLSSRLAEAMTVFTGGMPLDRMTGRMPCLSISRGRSLTVLEMEHNIIDFVCMCDTPFSHDMQDPFAVLVLLQNDLVVIDLNSSGYPCFENPYAMDMHDAPVTCCQVLADCPPDLIPAFYTIGQRTRTNTNISSNVASADHTIAAMQNGVVTSGGGGGGMGASLGSTVMSILNTAAGVNENASAFGTAPTVQFEAPQQTNAARCNSAFSSKPWPITGGYWGNAISSSQTLIVTGHADGALKFWDASAGNFQILYKLKSSKIFERVRRRPRDAASTSSAPNSTSSSSQPIPAASDGVDSTSNSNCNSSSATAGGAPAVGSSSLAKGASQSDEPFAILNVSFCADSRRLAVSAQSYVILFVFSKREVVSDVPTVTITINCDVADEMDGLTLSVSTTGGTTANEQNNAPPPSTVDVPKQPAVRVKQGQRRWPVGYYPDLVVSVASQNDAQPPLTITAVAFSTHYGLLAVGTENGIGIVDFIQHVCVASLTTPDLYGSLDPFIRAKPKFQNSKVGDETAKPGEQLAPSGGLQHAYSHSQVSLTVLPTASGAPMSPLTGASRHKRLAGAASVGGGPYSSSSNLNHSNLIAPPGVTQPNSSSPTGVSAGGLAYGLQSPSLFAEFKRTRSQKNSPAKSACALGPPPSYSPSKTAIASRTLSSSSLGFGIKEELLAERANDANPHAHSSSTSSLDVVSQESIQLLSFYDSFARKSDSSLSPCLYVGTCLGTVIVLSVNLPEARSTQPVIVAPNNTLIRLKGAIQCVQLLDCRGSVLHAPSERWEEARSASSFSPAEASSTSTSGYASGSGSVGGSGSSTERRDRVQQVRGTGQQGSPGGSTSEHVQLTHVQSASVLALTEKEKLASASSYQIAVICSEKQARVVKLPSLACAYSTNVTETSCVLKAAVFKFRDGASVLGCYLANGHIMVLGIPSLRPLLDCNVMPPADMRITRTLQFGAGGLIAYFCSPSEIQLFTISADDAAQLSEMLAVLYVQKQAPEPPKQTLMSMLFGGPATANVDREELFGVTNSTMTKGTAKQLTAATSAMAGAQDKASGVAGDVRRAQMQLHERGDRLGELDLKTEQMMNDSKIYAQHAHQLMMKFQQKKWYQF